MDHVVSVSGRLAAAFLMLAAALSPPASAAEDEAPSALKLSGFLSLVGGKVSGSLDGSYVGPAAIDGHDCPCYVADWGNAGVYTKHFSLAPESRAGVQAKYTVNPMLSVVGQVVVRGSDPVPNLQWAYASFALSKQWEVQVGRKRIPLYYYSDFQDIGVSYPWVAVPPELYGWEATNYNGASVRYKTALGDTSISASLFAGKETVRDSLYQRLFYDSQTKVAWNKLIGADAEANHGPLTVRAVYMQTTVHSTNPTAGLDDTARLKAYGVALNLDFEDWFVLSELTQLTRDVDTGYRITAPALTVGAGYHFGKWTPFLNYARYVERTSDATAYAPQSYKRASITLRYDVDARSALKAQLDRQRDVTHNFGGDVTVMRLAYDRLF